MLNLKTVCVVVMAMAVAGCASHNAGPETRAAHRPNVVLIVADDMGYADAGFQGSTDIPTPHLDRIAREGVRLTDAYVTFPVCGPSRAGFITGRHQDRFGSSVNPTIDPTVPNGVPASELMISEMLKEAGYRTMAVGKWHLGTYEGLRPLDRGFDEFFGFLSGGHDYFADRYTLQDLSEVRKRWDWYRTKLLHNDERIEAEGYLTDLLSDAAVEFIAREHEADPYFVYLAYNAPHTPMQATDEYLARFNHIENKDRRTYAAMMAAMDDGIGRVLEAIDQRNDAANTLVVFFSDNGGARNNASRNTPLRGYKSDPFEGGVRVPYIMRWPVAIAPGTVYERPVSTMDVAGTVAAAIDRPTSGKPLDGVDLIPYLGSRRVDDPHDAIFWRWHRDGRFAVRAGDLKLIAYDDSSRPAMLFDLATDPSERRNLLSGEDANDQTRADANRLRELANAWISELVPPAYPGLGSWMPR